MVKVAEAITLSVCVCFKSKIARGLVLAKIFIKNKTDVTKEESKNETGDNRISPNVTLTHE